jgi:hypothetical protein
MTYAFLPVLDANGEQVVRPPKAGEWYLSDFGVTAARARDEHPVALPIYTRVAYSPDTAAEVAFADTSPITPAALEQLGYERKSDTRFTGTDSTIWLRDGVAEIKSAHLQASQIRTLGQLRHLVAALAERTA